MSRSRKNRRKNKKVTTTTTKTTTVQRKAPSVQRKVAPSVQEIAQRRADQRSLVRDSMDLGALSTICSLPEVEFGETFDMETYIIGSESWRGDENYYFYKDNGSDILAVAHLDTVVHSSEREARFVNTEDGWVVFSGALDDRLGAFIILDLLPALGIQFDILLTVGEESGQSTAEWFDPPKDYNWMIEFDRGGTDVVMYEYEDSYVGNLVRSTGARTGVGSFSDISYMEHVGAKGFNWGVGYQDYHGPRSHAFLEDTIKMVAYFLTFHEANADVKMPHRKTFKYGGRSTYGGHGGWWDDSRWDSPASQEWAKGYHEFDDEDPDVEIVDEDEYVKDIEQLWPTDEELEQIEDEEAYASYTVVKSAVEKCVEEGGPDFPRLEDREKVDSD